MKIVVINLRTAITRWKEMLRNLSALEGISLEDVHRFEAKLVDRSASPLTTICKHLCPPTTIGCALSHREVAINALNSGWSFPILVLEDDAYFIGAKFENDITSEIERNCDYDWDMILLEHISIFGVALGSNAAYLLSKRGAEKTRDAIIPWHVDVFRNSRHFNICTSSTQLFKTLDLKPTGIIIGGRDIAWFAHQPMLRLGSDQLIFRGGHAVIVLLTCILAMLFSVTRGIAIYVCAAVLSIMTAFGWYVLRDSNCVKHTRNQYLFCALTAVVCLTIIILTPQMKSASSPSSIAMFFMGCFILTTAILRRDESTTAERLRCAPSIPDSSSGVQSQKATVRSD